jgi:hypothetical protein
VTIGTDDLIKLQSRTYYVGEKGEEISDYSENWTVKRNAAGTAFTDSVEKSSTIFCYDGDTGLDRASDASVSSETRMTRSDTYKYDTAFVTDVTLGTDDLIRLQSRTHYVGEKGEEISDYSENWTVKKNAEGTAYIDSDQKSSTIFYYNGDTGLDRASDASVSSETRMTRIDTYKYDTSFVTDVTIGTDDLIKLQSRTHYVGEKSEEISDYSENWTVKRNAAGTAFTDSIEKSSTIFYYDGDTGLDRASDASVSSETRMTRSDTYKFDTSFVTDVTIGTDDLIKLQSRTYYVGEKGEEISDYSENWTVKKNAEGTAYIDSVEKSSTIFYYNGDTGLDRASDASVSSETGMTRSDTYKFDTSFVMDVTLGTDDLIKLQSRTYYVGEKGEEISDYSENWTVKRNAAGTAYIDSVEKSSTIFYYDGDTGLDRASDASVSSETRMTRSDTYKYETSFVTDVTIGTNDLVKLQSRTYYAGEKGEEISDYSENWTVKRNDDGTAYIDSVEKSSTIFYYDGDTGLDRASDASVSSDTRMTRSDTYKYDTAFVADVTIGTDDLMKLQSRTYYVGDKGEEISDYSENWTIKRNAAGTAYIDSVEKSSTIFYYDGGTGLDRAGDASVSSETRMTRSDTYKYDTAFVANVTIGTDDLIKLQSRTHYVGEKGEEISDYSENWTIKRNAAGTAYIDSVEKSSTIFYYDGDTALDRASDASVSSETRMTRSDTYKFDTSFVADVTIGTDDLIKLQSRTCYVGEKGEEISDYSENWTVKRNAAGTAYVDSVEKSSTIFYYDGGTGLDRAGDASVSSETRMTRSDTYKFDTSFVKDVTIGTDDLIQIQSRTYYVGEKGEEVSDYSENWTVKRNAAGTAYIDSVEKSSTIFYYNGNTELDRASDPSVSSETRMTRSDTYKYDTSFVTDVTIGTDDLIKLQSRTYYVGEKGEEISDYSENWTVKRNAAGTADIDSVEKSSTIFYYNGNTGRDRASDASVSSETRMTRSDTYKYDTVFVTDVTMGIDDLIKLQSRTYYVGEKGEEISDYSENWTVKKNADGTAYTASVEKSSTIFYYAGDTGLDRASDQNVSSETRMTRSDTYKFDTSFVTDVTIGTDDLIKLQSRTYYVGEKGEEISDYSENWTVKRNAAGTAYVDSVEKSSTIFYYNGNTGLDRASDASVSSETRMTRSDTYKFDTTFVADVTIGTNDLIKLQSRTYYVGEKGEEISDYGENWTVKRNADGTAYIDSVEKSSTIFYYDGDTGIDRASDASVSSEIRMI